MTTWPSSSAASSSPPDFTAHALGRPPRKKPEPFSQPGRQPEHDQQKLRSTRDHGPSQYPSYQTPEDTSPRIRRSDSESLSQANYVVAVAAVSAVRTSVPAWLTASEA